VINPFQKISEEVFDEWIRLMLIGYYLPYFVVANADEWLKLGVTLNGVRPICKN
jgi:hypothetical protein